MNRDASLFCSGTGSGLVARRGGVALSDYCGSAVPRPVARHAGLAGHNLRRNRFGHGRSNHRSRPACGSARRGTAALTPPRHEMPEGLVDLRHDCRDIGPACVPGTGVGHGVELNRQVQISAPCLPLKRGQSYPPVAAAPACGHGAWTVLPHPAHPFTEPAIPKDPVTSGNGSPLRRIDADSDSHRHKWTG